MFQSVWSAALPLDEVLFGLSSGLFALFDDLPDLSSRPLPGLLNTIVFCLALSQREAAKLRFFETLFLIFCYTPESAFKAFKARFRASI